MDYPARFKVVLVVYQFEWEAKFWWGTVKTRVGEALLTWGQLKELMMLNTIQSMLRELKNRSY